MARKSLEQQLLDAVASQNFTLAQELTTKIQKKKKPKKAKSTKPAKVVIHEYEDEDEDEDEEEEYISKPKARSKIILPSDNTGRKFCSIESINVSKKRPNKFKDDKSLSKEDLSVVGSKGVEKTRRDYKPVLVKCRICGKQEKVSPSLAGVSIGGEQTSYRCNDCCSGRN